VLSAGGDIDIRAGKAAYNEGGRVLAMGDLTVTAPVSYARGITGYSALGWDRGFKAFFGDGWARLYATDVGGSWMANGRTQINGDTVTDGGSFDGNVVVSGMSTVIRARHRDPVSIESHLGLTTWFWRRKPDSLRAAVWAATVMACAPAWAQIPSAALVPEDPAQRLLREQRQRELEREATQPPARIEVPAVVPADAPVEAVPETSTTFEIHRIGVVGNTVLSDSEVEAITAPFVGRALGTNRITLLLRRFTEAFCRRGLHHHARLSWRAESCQRGAGHHRRARQGGGDHAERRDDPAERPPAV
jgi:hypothetical protein